uniref:Uncharacterized protein n=1 Tax=Opuntia streptacantha TaxID=393608 RepID=A0A7C9E5J7_OPUST
MFASSFSRYASLCLDSSAFLCSSASLSSFSCRAASYASSLSLKTASSFLSSEGDGPWSCRFTGVSLLPFLAAPTDLRGVGEFFKADSSDDSLSFWFISLATSSDNAFNSTAAAEANPFAYELSSASFLFRCSSWSLVSFSSVTFCFSSSISLA